VTAPSSILARPEEAFVDSAVLFDFGGTLDADGVAWKERFHCHFAVEGVSVEPARFDPLFHAVDDALVGTVPASLSLDDTVRRVADGVAAALRPGDTTLGARVAARFVSEAHACFEANAPVLERLARRYRLGIVSNFYGNLSTVCDNANVRQYFDVIVDSAQVGFLKPDPRIFLAAIEALGIEPARTVMVGDSLARDMAGARAAGLVHVWLAPDPARQGSPCCREDCVIRTLREVEGVLR
jgi:putative hydrolase of the HAD superfamily